MDSGRIFIFAAAVFAVTAFTVGCGRETTDNAPRPSFRLATRSAAIRPLQVPQDITSARVRIEGCKSGFAPEYSSSADIILYRGDRGCKGRLLRFTKDQTQFTPVPNYDFTDLSEGDWAIFADDTGTTPMKVTIASQVNDPVDATDSIRFIISPAPTDSSQFDILNMHLGKGTTVKTDPRDDPPAFRLHRSRLRNTVPDGQTFRFVFDLECKRRLKQTTDPERASCAKNPLKNIRYVLVTDVYQDEPCDKQNADPCQALFDSGSQEVVPSEDMILPGDQDMRNGGFHTRDNLRESLVGPENIDQNREALLVLTNGSSFQYFNVDLNPTLEP